jgi:hypothetical protein
MTYRAQIDAILDAGGWTTDRQVAAGLGCAKSTVSQHRRGWQRAHGVAHGGNGQERLPDDVVALIWEAREDEKMSWREVSQAVKEVYGIQVTVARVSDLYRAGGYTEKRSSPNVNPDEVSFPLATIVGTMYGPPIKAPAHAHKGLGKYQCCCDHCKYRAHCLAHPGDVCQCETVQIDEVLE